MKLTFYGATKSVTGSSFLLEGDSGKILIDCGLYQCSRYCEEQNFEKFKFDPKSLDAVIVTHAHIDHIGRTPKLYKEGFRGKVFSTSPTRDFARYLLADSMKILKDDARELGVGFIYETEDIEGIMSLWEKVAYHEKFKIAGFEVELYDAGHVLGSSFIVVTSSDGKKIVFSGDLGNSPTPLINSIEKVRGIDYAVVESTYGGRVHEDVDARKGILEDIIEETIKSSGVLMIPAFALERTQEILFELNELVENGRIPQVPVFMDSPLAIKLTDVYKKYARDEKYFNMAAIELGRTGDAIFDFPGLKFTLRTDESKMIADVPPPKVIIAGSGMSQGGRIIHHEKRYLSDPKNAILFVGYQAINSPGRRILDGEESIKILGEDVPVRARIRAIGGYSAHADQPALLRWLHPMRTTLKKVFLVHGEEDQMGALSAKIRDNLAIDTEIPSLGEEVIL